MPEEIKNKLDVMKAEAKRLSALVPGVVKRSESYKCADNLLNELFIIADWQDEVNDRMMKKLCECLGIDDEREVFEQLGMGDYHGRN